MKGQNGPRCQAQVSRRDTYRRTGRTKSGFQMHYIEDQCKRRAAKDNGDFCHQHTRARRCRWARP